MLMLGSILRAMADIQSIPEVHMCLCLCPDEGFLVHFIEVSISRGAHLWLPGMLRGTSF